MGPSNYWCIKNIARIANAVQVTLWLSVANRQCHDWSFSLDHHMALNVSVYCLLSERSHSLPQLCSTLKKLKSKVFDSLSDKVTYWAVLNSRKWWYVRAQAGMGDFVSEDLLDLVFGRRICMSSVCCTPSPSMLLPCQSKGQKNSVW